MFEGCGEEPQCSIARKRAFQATFTRNESRVPPVGKADKGFRWRLERVGEMGK